MLHKNEEKTEQNSASFRKPTSIERGLRPNGYFPLMRQPLFVSKRSGKQTLALEKLGNSHQAPHIDPLFVYFRLFNTSLPTFSAGFMACFCPF